MSLVDSLKENMVYIIIGFIIALALFYFYKHESFNSNAPICPNTDSNGCCSLKPNEPDLCWNPGSCNGMCTLS